VVVVQEEKRKILVEGEEEVEEKLEEEGEEKVRKYNPMDYSWSLSDGNSKNVLKVYNKLFESAEFSNTFVKFES
jgi:hypothetical protein